LIFFTLFGNIYLDAGVVQRLVCGLAKAETAVRFRSLAPLRELLTPRVSFILQKYPISLVDMGFFHV
jgi:hypothetical protein